MVFKLPEWKYIRYGIEEQWERLGIRKCVNANPKIIIGVTAVCVLVLLGIIIGILIPEKTERVEGYKKEWFYDLNTGELFIAKVGQKPPIEAPSGLLSNGKPAGARAYVLSYAYEPNESERFIGFLEIADPNAEELKTDNTRERRQWGHGRLLRRVEDEQWVPADSKEGRAIVEEAYMPNENGEPPHYCPPK